MLIINVTYFVKLYLLGKGVPLMNKAELIEHVAKKADMTKADAATCS